MSATSNESTQPSQNIRDRFAIWFGVSVETRELALKSIRASQEQTSTGYWVHLLLSMAIATLGLVLGSTAVIIGAMLVAPLMGPIVAIGMGLALGSVELSFRALLRVALSIVVVVVSSALIARWVPLRDTNAEILARTTPNVLDLLIAIACALAAAYSAARNVSDIGSTAAGTSIGISLVPPLCVVGYGLGTEQWEVARGASLLFTANFSAIVLFATITFVAFGFDRTQSQTEALHLFSTDTTTRHKLLLRVLLPVALTGIVFVPLRRALSDVVSQVQTRQKAQSIVDAATRSQTVVRSSVVATTDGVKIRLVIVGSFSTGVELESTLRARLATAGIRQVDVHVATVADASQLALKTAEPATLPETESASQAWVTFSSRIDDSLRNAWPRTDVGELLGWSVTSLSERRARLIVYVGEPGIGTSGERFLERSIAHSTDFEVSLSTFSLPTQPQFVDDAAPDVWLTRLRFTHAQIEPTQLFLCIGVPEVAPEVVVAPEVLSDASSLDAGPDSQSMGAFAPDSASDVVAVDALILPPQSSPRETNSRHLASAIREQIRLFAFDPNSTRVISFASEKGFYAVRRDGCSDFLSEGRTP